MKLNEAVAIVTGAAAGFGRGFAERVLQGGGRVFMTDVNVEQLEITGKELAAKFGSHKVAWTHQNVVEWDSFHNIFDQATTKFKSPVNLLVNNAGIAGDMTMWNEDAPRSWERVITIDLTALMRGTQVAVQQMRKTLGGKEGVVVNLASFAGLYPQTYGPEYSAAKHGVVGFTRSCHPLKKDYNIRVVALAPGFASTAMGNIAKDLFPGDVAAMGGMIDIGQVVDAFQFALEDETNPGRILRVVKGGHAYNRFPGDKAIYAKL